MKRIMILVSIVLVCFSHILAQENVNGMVFELDKKGNQIPLVGANVYWAETTIGTTTNEDGFFQIEKSNKSNFLVFSYISYVNDTIDINKNSSEQVKVILKSAKELDEVVISERNSSFHSTLEAVQVQKLTGAELQKAACCNLSESFETNASVDVSYSDAVTGAKQIELLGLAGKYSQILAEKMPLVRGLSSTYGLGYIPGSWMDGISISKGTSSVVDGYEAITGQINVEYKKPDNGEALFINAFANTMGKYEANLNTRMTLGIMEKWSTGLLVHGENNSWKFDNNGDTFIDHPLISQFNVFNRWKFNSGKKFISQAGIKVLGERRIGGQYDFDGTIAGLTSNYGVLVNTQRYEGFLKGGYVFNKPGTSIGFINSLTYYNQESYVGQNIHFASQNSYYGNIIFQSIIGNTNHSYSTGISFIYDNYDETFNNTVLDRIEYVPGAFFQYTYKYLEKATVMLGIRADYHNIYGDFYTPRMNVKYTFPGKVVVRVSAGKGYRTPNVYAENSNLLATSRNIVVTDEIKQEQAWNYGITLTKSFKLNKQELVFYSEFYRTDFVNQMVVDLDSDVSTIFISNLDGKSYSNIAQVELQYKPIKGMEIVGAYRWTDVKTTIVGELTEKPMINAYKALANVSYQTPKKKWQFDFTAQFNGGGRLPENHPDENFDPFTILNAQITKFFKRWEIYIGGENLTNFVQENPILSGSNPYSDSFDASTIWGPIVGRKFYLGVRLSLESKKNVHNH